MLAVLSGLSGQTHEDRAYKGAFFFRRRHPQTAVSVCGCHSGTSSRRTDVRKAEQGEADGGLRVTQMEGNSSLGAPSKGVTRPTKLVLPQLRVQTAPRFISNSGRDLEPLKVPRDGMFKMMQTAARISLLTR